MQTNLRSSRRARLTSAVMITALALSLFGNARLTNIIMPTAHADMTYFNLAGGNFTQNWSNTALITTDNDWSGVPSITGYRGDNLTASSGTDPQTIVADGSATPINVFANQNVNPGNPSAGGIYEFETTPGLTPADNPVVGFQGSGTADAPHLVIFLNTTGRNTVTVSYNLRDIDASTGQVGVIQSVALQYRVGTTGNFTNIASAYVANANNGGTTPVSAVLPTEANNQAQVQVRVITSNAGGDDALIGIDDISVTSNPPPLTDSQTVYGVTSGNTLINFNTTTPGTVNTVGTITPITGTIIGIDFRPSGDSATRGLLYAVTNDAGTGRIYTINLQTAEATLVSMLVADTVNDTTPDYAGLTGTSFGVDFNPVPDRLRVVSNTGQNLRINVNTGATITDGVINPGTPSIVAVGYTNPDNDPATGTTLYDIDSSTDTLFIQNPPNDGTLATVGALGVDASDVAGFDIARNGNGFAVFNVNGTPSIYQIDLGSGAATSGGTLNTGGLGIVGIAIADISPTADTVTIEGRVTTPDGTPLSGVTLRLSGSQQAVALTDDDGGYRFESVEVGGIYTVSASHRGYRFASSQRTFGDVQTNTVADFVASPIKGRSSRSRFSRF